MNTSRNQTRTSIISVIVEEESSRNSRSPQRALIEESKEDLFERSIRQRVSEPPSAVICPALIDSKMTFSNNSTPIKQRLVSNDTVKVIADEVNFSSNNKSSHDTVENLGVKAASDIAALNQLKV